MFRLTLYINPLPRPRPQHSRYHKGIFYPKKYRDFADTIKQEIWLKSLTYKKKTTFPMEGDLKILISAHRKGKRRADGDSIEGGIWDALQKANVILNDNQFVDHTTRIFYDAPKPRIEISVWKK